MEVEEEDFDDYDEQARLGGGRRPTADESTRISFLSFFLSFPPSSFRIICRPQKLWTDYIESKKEGKRVS